MAEAKDWLRMRLRKFHVAAQARDRTRMEMAEFNASLHHSSLSQDSLQSPRVARGGGPEGTANVFEAKYPRVKEEGRVEEQEPPREVSSVQFNSSTPSTMGMGVEERQAPEAGPFTRPARSQYRASPDRRACKASVVSPALKRRSGMGQRHEGGCQRLEYHAYIPWVHREGREEMRVMGLAYLAMPDEEGAMERCQEVRQEAQVSVAEECQEALAMTANQVLWGA